jgi:uncharacterized membrane protein YphA (DoxX/SURF4 family)
MTIEAPAKRFILLFAFAFFLFANLPLPFAVLPGGTRAFAWLAVLWRAVVPTAAEHLFHLHVTLPEAWNGSVDTSFHYIQYAVWALVSLIVAAFATPLLRDARRYRRTSRWFFIYLRYALAVALIRYGAAKVLGNQFPFPTLDVLVEPFGSASPMGLAWMFMGASRWFKLFAGAVEMIGGVLLTIRRTTLLGALLVVAVMSNVAAMNICYGVPVRTYALQLLMMACILVLPHRRRLADLLLRNRTPKLPEPPEPPLFSRRRIELALLALRTLAVLFVVLQAVRSEERWRLRAGELAPRSPLRGIWNVDELAEDGFQRPPLVTDRTRWRRIVFDGPLFMSIFDMADRRSRFRATLDPNAHVAHLVLVDSPRDTIDLAYERPRPDTLVVDTVVGGHHFHAICRREDERAFPLTSRGIHWIDERPFFQ